MFLEELQKQFAELEGEKDPLKIRTRAWENFLKIGLPQKKHEAFQYLPLREFYSQNFSFQPSILTKNEIAPYLLPECASSYLVFINGVYVPELSCIPKGLILQPLSQAMTTYGVFLQKRLKQLIDEEKDPFSLLNLCFSKEGIFVYLPPKTQVEAPLQSLHFITKKGASSHSRAHFFVGKESEIKIVSTFHPLEEGWINSVLDISLEDGAKVASTSVVAKATNAWIFESTRVNAKRNSYFHGVNITSGAKSHRQNFVISLLEENAEALLDGVSILQKSFQSHAHVLMDHQAPFTRSKQLFKGVLDGTSQSSFEGKILVRQQAQKTEAYQLNNNLMLGEHAQAFSKPNLEIFADDVKASHGATFGRLDSQALFYLKTRGISEEAAKRLLVNAFCLEVGLKVQIPSVSRQFSEQICEFLE
jgi:Fe-S cluster assembly protein SufD